MTKTKIAALALGIPIGLVLVTGLILPKTSVVERTAVVNAPHAVTASFITDLRTQPSWSAWAEMDPGQSWSFEGTPSAPGFVMRWQSNVVGSGSQEILALSDSTMDLKLTFTDPWESVSNASFFFKPAGENQTTVRWSLTMDAPFPMNVFFLLMNMEGQIGRDFERGLFKLDSLATIDAAANWSRGFKVERLTLAPLTYLLKRSVVAFDQMDAFMKNALADVRAELGRQNASAETPDAGLYFQWDEANARSEMAAAIGTSSALRSARGLELRTVEGSALRIRFTGRPAGTGNCHYALDDFMKTHHLQPVLVMEHHVDHTPADTSAWVTDVIYLVQPAH